MNITILWGGNIGRTIAEQFMREEHNVFLVENSRTEIDIIEDNLDIAVIRGNANNTATLEEANIKEADILIAVTDDDNTNMLAGEVANAYNKSCKKIVRISDVSYLTNEHILSKIDLKIDHVINSEEILAQNLKESLGLPGTTFLYAFLEKKITLGGFKIKPNSPLLWHKIKDLDLPPEAKAIVYAADGHFYLADAEQIIQEYAVLYLTFPVKLWKEIQKKIFETPPKIKSLVIFENGKKDIRKSYYLTEMLGQELKINDLRIVEESAQVAQELSKLSHNLVINGQITKPSFWFNQELNEADAFIAFSENNERNILAGLIANQLGVPFVYTMADLPEYTTLTSSTPLTAILSPSVLSINKILNYTHQGKINNMAILNYLDLEAVEFEVSAKSKILKKGLKIILQQNNLILAHVLRGGELIEFNQKTKPEVGDKFLVITKIDNLAFLTELF